MKTREQILKEVHKNIIGKSLELSQNVLLTEMLDVLISIRDLLNKEDK